MSASSPRRQSLRNLSGMLLLVGVASIACLLLLGMPGAAVADTFVNNGLPIPADDATPPGVGPFTPGIANPYPSVTNVFGMTGVVTKVQVAVIGLEHHNPDDLNLLLVAPNGHGLQLMSDVGGATATANTGVSLNFEDAAGGTIPTDGPLSTGVYKPSDDFGGMGEETYYATTGNTGDVYPSPAPSAANWASNTTLAQAFNGAAPNGNWSLYITDDNSNGLIGGLDAPGAYWGLTITTGPGVGATTPPPNAKFSIAKSSTNKYATTFDASASLAAGAVADSFKWDFNSDGKSDAQCPGSDPVLTTKFDGSGTVNATLTVSGAGATSTSRLSSPVTGIGSGKRATKSSQSGALSRQTFICAPITGHPPPTDLTDGGGPPQECGQTVEFDIVEAIGCFTTAESLTSIPSAERAILSDVARGFAGTERNVQIAAGTGTVPVSSLVTTQQRVIAVSTKPVRLNGLDFYPKPGAAIVLVSPVTKGLLLPESMPGYILSSDADVKIGGITLKSGSIRLPLGFAGIRAKSHLGDFTLSKAPLIGDLPIQGKIGVDLAFRRTEIPINVTLPGIFKSAAGQSVSGSALLTADNGSGILLDQLHLSVPHASVAGLGIDDLDFSYKRQDATWDASATVSFPPGASISARVLIQNGALQYIFVHAVPPNPGIHSAPGVFITYLDFTFDGRNGGTSIGGGIGVAAGPKVATPYGQCSLIGVDGHFALNVSDPISYRADGDVRWLCIHLVHGYYLANTNGYFELGGDAVLKITDDLEFSAKLKVGAQFTMDHAQVDAELNACVKFWIAGGCVGAEVVASDVGIGVCADLGFTHAGGGIVFPTKVLLFADSCDISRFRSLNKFARTSATSGEQSFKWGAGKPSGLVAVTGNGAPPAFTLTGPGGRTIHATGTEKLPDHVVISRALDNTTYLFVRSPAAGTWKVTPDAGNAVTNVQVADGVPAPDVSGKVIGHGRHRVLAYNAAPQAGQSVQFSLEGPSTSLPIGKARGLHGKLKIKIPATASGKMKVIANVSRDGLPRGNDVIATFVARPLKLPATGRLSIARKGSKLKLSWSGVTGATNYLVTFKLSDGNRSQFKTQKRKLVLNTLPPSARGRITVQAVPDLGKPGAKRSATLKSIRAPKVKP